MASIFTYDPDPPRVSSPWSTSGSSTPQIVTSGTPGKVTRSRPNELLGSYDSNHLSDYGITKLEAEPQEGPTEYKLHLLLRPRRLYTSMSTGHLVAGSYHSKFGVSTSSPCQGIAEVNAKSPQTPSSHSRQQRLQQLTTQLLWRLQQSSPFHSTSTANLVLPVLPEATPKLGVPMKPARLLPGLEESQGALYEIGVADDGTFVGLTEDELDESLDNLRAMAASLGCKVDILRRVIVGGCEWAEDTRLEDADDSIKIYSGNLLVAEALVRPDLDYYSTQSTMAQPLHQMDLAMLSINENNESVTVTEGSGFSHTEQLRVSITGPSGAGKSSLLGTLTTSTLDNGRGKSRLSLLKHRHEIASGITSSVAQELIGYGPDTPSPDYTVDVFNYSSGNVAAWDDIHAASEGGRLVFVSDLPGLPRYVKSTLRGLVSWAPHYIILCISANCYENSEARVPEDHKTEIELCLSYLELCIKIAVPILLVITKLDLASRSGLKQTLTKVLSALKVWGKKPLMLSVATETPAQASDPSLITTADCEEAHKTVINIGNNWSHTVPVILASAVNGSGIGKLHALLRYLPLPKSPPSRSVHSDTVACRLEPTIDVFDIDEVFTMPLSKVYSTSEAPRQENRGIVLCGLVRHGSVSIGDELMLGPMIVDSRTDDDSAHNTPRGQSLHISENPANFSPQSRRFQRRPSSDDFSMSSPSQSVFSGKSRILDHPEWQRVRVTSVRNLRLSVRTLLEDQVGTIGIEKRPTLDSDKNLARFGRIRKGMVLFKPSRSSQDVHLNSIPRYLTFSVGCIATFPSSEFASPLSPPLILGGNAIIYTANIRTATRVTCVALADNDSITAPSSPVELDFFGFDSDDINVGNRSDNPRYQTDVQSEGAIKIPGDFLHEDIKITFTFISSVEFIQVGLPVVVMPGALTMSFGAGEHVARSRLEGFVGTISDVLIVDENVEP